MLADRAGHVNRMPAPPRGETEAQRDLRRAKAKMAPIDMLAESLQHDAGAPRRQASCTHTPSVPPVCCWCGAREHTVTLP